MVESEDVELVFVSEVHRPSTQYARVGASGAGSGAPVEWTAMTSGADLFVVCKQCGSEVSPYITECPYCGQPAEAARAEAAARHAPSRRARCYKRVVALLRGGRRGQPARRRAAPRTGRDGGLGAPLRDDRARVFSCARWMRHAPNRRSTRGSRRRAAARRLVAALDQLVRLQSGALRPSR